jgi:hypothetical protein
MCRLSAVVSSQGGSGLVFKAMHGDRKVAVKIVLPPFCAQLEKEFNVLHKYAKTGLPLVEPVSSFVHGAVGAGYAMAPAASGHVARGDLLETVDQVSIVGHAFQCLNRLHNGGLVHGDPRFAYNTVCCCWPFLIYRCACRLANFLRCNENKFVWGDTMASENAENAILGTRRDMDILVTSCLGVMSQEIRAIVDQYAPLTGADRIIQAVVLALEKEKGDKEEDNGESKEEGNN